ncbi:sensor histidine kinase [Desulfosporosinus youngiae]|uniref:histidine kinase n=1 Tax=Desulfosporosinus youngiae DSM 17734 TaxID=768710 RepID=H5Y657_9FIRM|nr:HAMP domain-containing sensor histidine kinase [Desulfosporosinus youngiae]EHQ91067.1 signal transduction histidine kinase [Desulfosporosinus youngiae DSM 17734]
MFKIKLGSKLALCTLSAFLLASVVFLAVHKIGALWIDDKFHDLAFVEQQQDLEIQNLQEYINNSQASALDYHFVSRWVKERELTTLFLYYGDRLIYDSTISYHAGNLASGRLTAPLPWQKTYSLQFSDVEVTAVVSTFSRHRFEDRLNFICLTVFFFTFFLIMLYYVRRKVVYIHRLAQEIKNIETGNLNFPITIKGDDELSSLARDVDKMRHALLKQIIRFQKVRKDRDQFAVHMSHDLRTPVTSLIGYLDIVNQKRCPSKEVQEQYLHKAEEKALQLKGLSENMFKHFLTSMDESQSEDIFCDSSAINLLIDDGLVLLESHLFQCLAAKYEGDPAFFSIRKTSLQRVFDNIFSNLLKYANPAFPIDLSCHKSDKGLVISFTNHIRQEKTDTVSSAGIGLKSADEIIRQNGGYLRTHKHDGVFQCILFIPEIP